MSLTATIIAILLLIVSEVYFSQRKPAYSFKEFVIRLVAMVGLIILVWLPGHSEAGSVNAKILLTAIGLISIVQSFFAYKRGLKKYTN